MRKKGKVKKAKDEEVNGIREGYGVPRAHTRRYFLRNPNSVLQHSVWYVEEGLCAENRLDPFSRFDTIPACDGQDSTRS